MLPARTISSWHWPGSKVAGRDEDESVDFNLDDNGTDEIGCETGSPETGV